MKTVKSAALFVAAILTTIIVSRYLTMNPEVYFPEQRETYMAHQVALLVHVVGGMVAMMIGPFQFVRGLRTRFVTLHRVMGVCYIAACFAGGIAGLMMATRAYGGFPSGAGFGMLAIAWMVCAVLALQRALTARYAAHREWMIRSYSLTLAAFSLRVILMVHGTLFGSGVIEVPYIEMYVAVAWLCWVPNLAIAEWYIYSTRARNELEV